MQQFSLRKKYKLFFLLFVFIGQLGANPTLLSVEKIWSQDPSSAFVTMIEYEGVIWIAFRGSDLHAGGRDGVIRILKKSATAGFELVKTLTKEGVDLRDPKFSITPKKELLLNMGGSRYEEGHLKIFYPEVAFYTAQTGWGTISTVPLPGEWIWGLAWTGDRGYGLSYSFVSKSNPGLGFQIKLFSTENGLQYQKVADLALESSPSEGALLFSENRLAFALIRRFGNSVIGEAKAPYSQWKWSDTGVGLEGPALAISPTGEIWVAARGWVLRGGEKVPKTVIGKMQEGKFNQLLELPSGGDNGYPALLFKEESLFCAYYSSHEEGGTSIYLAKIKP